MTQKNRAQQTNQEIDENLCKRNQAATAISQAIVIAEATNVKVMIQAVMMKVTAPEVIKRARDTKVRNTKHIICLSKRPVVELTHQETGKQINKVIYIHATKAMFALKTKG